MREALAVALMPDHPVSFPGPHDDYQRGARALASRPREWVAVREQVAEAISWRPRPSGGR